MWMAQLSMRCSQNAEDGWRSLGIATDSTNPLPVAGEKRNKKLIKDEWIIPRAISVVVEETDQLCYWLPW